MIRLLIESIRTSWKTFALTDLAFKLIAFMLLTPFVGLLLQMFLIVSGRSVLSDVDIARFFIHPLGWIALFALVTLSIAILALELSALMTIPIALREGVRWNAVSALAWTARKTPAILRLAGLVTVRLLLWIVPLVALGGGVYYLLLTGHDINFYLQEKPPRFWWAVFLIGGVLAILAGILVRCSLDWVLALPLLLFEEMPPRDCLAESRSRMSGHRTKFVGSVLVWLAVNALISLFVTAFVYQLGRFIVPGSTRSVTMLIFATGAIVLVWTAMSFIANAFFFMTLAVLQANVYLHSRSERRTVQLPVIGTFLRVRWNPRRFALAMALGAFVAVLIGASTIHSLRLDDDVEITAHRGASGRAPENTLASVLAAMEDGADWVEIDVQESSDGVVMVAHDKDFMKVARNPVKIWEATAEQLRSIDIGSSFDLRFKGERVPTLAEVLDACKGKIGVNIELKFYGHNQHLEQRVIDLVEERDMMSQVVVMSLNAGMVQKVKQLRPQWRVGMLTAVAIGDLTRVNADFLAVNMKLATPAFIRSAHAKDKAVHAWTINDEITLSLMMSRGVDNIITDHPARARQVLAQRATMSPLERTLVELASLFGVVPKGPNEQ